MVRHRLVPDVALGANEMSIRNFHRPYNRQVVTLPSEGVIKCGGCTHARAGYRLTNGTAVLYRCACCASTYAAPKWQKEALPHIVKQHEANVYGSYKELRERAPKGLTPEQLATFTLFRGRVEQLEARYQAERAGKRAAS